jgi:hypothetical protein
MRRDRLLDLVADDRINFILRKYGGTMWAWISFALDGDQFWAVVNTVMNLCMSWNEGNFLIR